TQALISSAAACAAASPMNGMLKPMERPPAAAAEPTRKLRRETSVRSRTCSVMVMSSYVPGSASLAVASRELDRGAHPVVGAASTDIRHAVVDVVVARLR